MILSRKEREKLQSAIQQAVLVIEDGPIKDIALIILALIYDMDEAEKGLPCRNCLGAENDACFLKEFDTLLEVSRKLDVDDPLDDVYLHRVADLARNLRTLSDHISAFRDKLVAIRENAVNRTAIQ